MDEKTNEIRRNAGYIITNSIWVRNIEFVLGRKDNSYVTWQCADGDCYWGHYFDDRLSAEKDLYTRAIEKIEDIQFSTRHSNTKKQNTKQRNDAR